MASRHRLSEVVRLYLGKIYVAKRRWIECLERSLVCTSASSRAHPDARAQLEHPLTSGLYWDVRRRRR